MWFLIALSRGHKFEILFKKWGDKLQLNVGDSVGQINQTSSGEWKLYEDKINKITITKKHGRRYFTRSVFYPLDADDVDNNTKEMEESIGQGYILTKEVFGWIYKGWLWYYNPIWPYGIWKVGCI